MLKYTIFRRQASATNSRVRWHVVDEIQADNTPLALREYGIEHACRQHGGAGTCVLVGSNGFPSYDTVEDGLYMAYPTERIDFEYYDVNGKFVELV